MLLNYISCYSLFLAVISAAALPKPYEFNLNINNNFNLNFKLTTEEQQQPTPAPSPPDNGRNPKNPVDTPAPAPAPPGLPASYNKNPKLFDLHKKLIEIPSVSHNEYAVSKYLEFYLKQAGFQVQLIPSEDGRNNLYAYHGELNSSKVLLTSHFDTVPPFIEYSVDNDDIYGRGSNDAKGSVAVQIISALEMIESGEISKEDLSLLFVHSEEIGGAGMVASNEYLVENGITWDAVIFGEPTENKLAVGHKGIYYFDLKLFGKSSHSGYPELGVDANNELINIMYDLSSTKWPSDELLGNTTVNIGLFNGGTAANVVSPEAGCTVLMRTAVDAETIGEIVKSIVDKYLENGDCELVFELLQEADPTFLDYQVEGFDTVIAKYSTDIPNLTETGYKRYLYGPGSITVAHGDNEFVSGSSLIQAVDDLKTLVKLYA